MKTIAYAFLSLWVCWLFLGACSGQDYPFLPTPNQGQTGTDLTTYAMGKGLFGFKHVATSGGTFFGLSDGALYHSTDGKTWDVESVYPHEFYTEAFPRVIAKGDHELFESFNMGEEWHRFDVPSDALKRPLVTIVGSKMFSISESGLFESEKGDGKKWVRLGLIPCELPNSLDIFDKLILLTCKKKKISVGAAEEPDYLFKSPDFGHTWTEVSNPSTDTADADFIVDSSEIYAVVADENNDSESTTSENNKLLKEISGKWVDVTPQIQGTRMFRGRAAISTPNGLLATCGGEVLCRSQDHGRSWSIVKLPYLGLWIDRLQSSGDDVLLRANRRNYGRTFYLSRNAGNTWDVVTFPPDSGQSVNASVINGFLYVRGLTSAYAKDLRNNGTWQQLKHLLPIGEQVLSSSEKDLYLLGSQAYRTSDLGQTWTTVASTTSRFPYALTRCNGGILFLQGSRETYISHDSGRSWDMVTASDAMVEMVAFTDNKLYAIIGRTGEKDIEHDISVAGNDFKSWSRLTELGAIRREDLRGFQVDDDGSIYVATSRTLQRWSADAGWTDVLTGPLLAGSVNCFLIHEGQLLVGTTKGLYWSTDGGHSWHSAIGDVAQYSDVRAIIHYDTRSFFVVTNTAYLFAINRVPPVMRADYFFLDIDGDPTSVLVDGLPLPGLVADRVAGQVRLRASKSTMQGLKDGLHEVYIKTSSATQEASQTIYVYKELAKANVFRPYGNSYALVIAASGAWDTAEFATLDRAVPQAKEVAAVLSAQGFKVETFFEENATRNKVERYLQQLASQLADSDRVLFYFSGHGETEPGLLGEVGYLLTYPATRKTLLTEAIPMARLQAEYVNLRAKHMLFVLDACFAGLAIQKSSNPSGDSLQKFLRYEELATYTRDSTRAILAAGTKGQPALDVNGGIFTKAFIAGISGGADYSSTGIITVDQLSAYVQEKVGSEAFRHGFVQTPQFGPLPVYGGGKFVFIK
jgi:hypothetical protein